MLYLSIGIRKQGESTLSESFNGSLEKAVKLEREMLQPVKERADYIINTTNLRPQYEVTNIQAVFSQWGRGAYSPLYKLWFYTNSTESDLIFDVRCLPNPFILMS